MAGSFWKWGEGYKNKSFVFKSLNFPLFSINSHNIFSRISFFNRLITSQNAYHHSSNWGYGGIFRDPLHKCERNQPSMKLMIGLKERDWWKKNLTGFDNIIHIQTLRNETNQNKTFCDSILKFPFSTTGYFRKSIVKSMIPGSFSQPNMLFPSQVWNAHSDENLRIDVIDPEDINRTVTNHLLDSSMYSVEAYFNKKIHSSGSMNKIEKKRLFTNKNNMHRFPFSRFFLKGFPLEIRARGIFNRVPTTKKSSKSTQNGFIERTFSIWLFNKLNNNAFLPAYLSKSLDKRERPSNSIETILNPMDNRQDWIRLTKLDKHSCAWEIPIVDWNDIVEYFFNSIFYSFFIHQDLDFENNHKSILLLEKTLLWFIELQFIFSQYFISNFNSISSKLYIKQLRILNFRTKVKTIFSLVSQKRTTTEKWLTTHISDSLMENHLTSREKKFKINSNSSSSIPSSNVVDQNDERKKAKRIKTRR